MKFFLFVAFFSLHQGIHCQDAGGSGNTTAQPVVRSPAMDLLIRIHQQHLKAITFCNKPLDCETGTRCDPVMGMCVPFDIPPIAAVEKTCNSSSECSDLYGCIQGGCQFCGPKVCQSNDDCCLGIPGHSFQCVALPHIPREDVELDNEEGDGQSKKQDKKKKSRKEKRDADSEEDGSNEEAEKKGKGKDGSTEETAEKKDYGKEKTKNEGEGDKKEAGAKSAKDAGMGGKKHKGGWKGKGGKKAHSGGKSLGLHSQKRCWAECVQDRDCQCPRLTGPLGGVPMACCNGICIPRATCYGTAAVPPAMFGTAAAAFGLGSMTAGSTGGAFALGTDFRLTGVPNTTAESTNQTTSSASETSETTTLATDFESTTSTTSTDAGEIAAVLAMSTTTAAENATTSEGAFTHNTETTSTDTTLAF